MALQQDPNPQPRIRRTKAGARVTSPETLGIAQGWASPRGGNRRRHPLLTNASKTARAG